MDENNNKQEADGNVSELSDLLASITFRGICYMNTSEALLLVKNKIPEGYAVVVKASKDELCVELETPDGTQSTSNDGNVVDQILSALDQAIDDAESLES